MTNYKNDSLNRNGYSQGKTSHVHTSNSRIGLGMAALGRPEYINVGKISKSEKSKVQMKQRAFEMLDFAYQQGVRDFDTAPSYGMGERFLLEWYKENVDRLQGLCLSTKWGYTYVADWELGYQGAHEIKEHSKAKLMEQWKTSKEFVPALSLYQIHSATKESGVLENEEVLEALGEIKRTFGIRIGITTSGIHQTELIQQALNISVQGEDLFDSFQVTYNIFLQDSFDVLKLAKTQGKTVIVKEALANGRVFPSYHILRNKVLGKVLARMAQNYNVGIDAIALRFVIDSLDPEMVLSGAVNKEQLLQNLQAQTFALSVGDLETLKSFCQIPSKYWNERSSLEWG